MTCDRVVGGTVAIVCSATRRCKCGTRATLACDWKVATRRSGTCDAPLCPRCTTSPARDKDLCPKHAIAFEQWKAARERAAGHTAGLGAGLPDPRPAPDYHSENANA